MVIWLGLVCGCCFSSFRLVRKCVLVVLVFWVVVCMKVIVFCGCLVCLFLLYMLMVRVL